MSATAAHYKALDINTDLQGSMIQTLVLHKVLEDNDSLRQLKIVDRETIEKLISDVDTMDIINTQLNNDIIALQVREANLMEVIARYERRVNRLIQQNNRLHLQLQPRPSFLSPTSTTRFLDFHSGSDTESGVSTDPEVEELD